MSNIKIIRRSQPVKWAMPIGTLSSSSMSTPYPSGNRAPKVTVASKRTLLVPIAFNAAALHSLFRLSLGRCFNSGMLETNQYNRGPRLSERVMDEVRNCRGGGGAAVVVGCGSGCVSSLPKVHYSMRLSTVPVVATNGLKFRIIAVLYVLSEVRLMWQITGGSNASL